MTRDGIKIDDQDIQPFGARRLKALLLLSQHPEIDEPNWLGRVELNFGNHLSVKGSVHPAAHEIETV